MDKAGFNATGRKTKKVQLIWNEPLGMTECPYAKT